MTSYILDPVDWASAGAVGDPGQRTFYLQARSAGDYLAVIVEKEQVAGLVQTASRLAGIAEAELRGGDLNLEPVQPEWRAGALRLGADDRGERFLLEIERAGSDEAIHWVMGRDELVAMVADGAYAVEATRRNRCRACGRRLDLDRAHHCG